MSPHMLFSNLVLKVAGGLIWLCEVRGFVMSATKRRATGKIP